MVKLAESSGTIVYEKNHKLVICNKPVQWVSTFQFVTGLLAFIFLSNGILQMFVLNRAQVASIQLGLILSALGIVFIILFWRMHVYQRKMNSLPPDAFKILCIIDLKENKLLDAGENMLTSLQQVRLAKRMQLTSSSPALELHWNTGSITIVQGNPFSGGVSAVEKALVSKGVRK
jgi:hypothetical protein